MMNHRDTVASSAPNGHPAAEDASPSRRWICQYLIGGIVFILGSAMALGGAGAVLAGGFILMLGGFGEFLLIQIEAMPQGRAKTGK